MPTATSALRRRDAEPAAIPAPSVAVRDLGVTYGPEPVLAGVTFSLAPAETLAVVGPSGCGKTTLLHALAGLLAPARGEVRVGGRVVAAAGREPEPGHAAYMFQSDLLLPWKSVLANATFAARLARRSPGRDVTPTGDLEARARELLREFGLGERLAARPRELSGGMRQRVALARTLLLGRGLVLLDEPFGSLDALTRAELQEWLLRVTLSHPATWVLVTHDVAEAVLLADRVAVLGGSPARLLGWVEVPVARSRRLAAGDEVTARALRATTEQVRRFLTLGRNR